MKSIVILIMAVAGLVGSARADNSANGSNSNGNEKICSFEANAQTETGQAELLKKCQRGDILNLDGFSPSIALHYCDFTKTIILHPRTGYVIGCVYNGSRRPIAK